MMLTIQDLGSSVRVNISRKFLLISSIQEVEEVVYKLADAPTTHSCIESINTD